MKGVIILIIGLVLANMMALIRYNNSQVHASISLKKIPEYTVEKLILPPDSNFYHGMAAMNNHGQITATFISTFASESKPLRAVLWDQGKYTLLGTLQNEGASAAFGINDSGQVVGWSDVKGGNQHAFVWEQGTMRDLGTAPSFPCSAATAINRQGWIVGRSYTPSNGAYWSWPSHATLWKEGKIYDLGVPDGCINSRATGVNNKGQITGWATDKKEQMTAVLWENGKWIDIGKRSGDDVSSGNAIDNSGYVLGTTGNSNIAMRGSIWKPNGVLKLSTLPYHSYNRLTAMGPDGLIFGDSKVGSEWGSAVLWRSDKQQPEEIDQLVSSKDDWLFTHIFSVNQKGQVLAFGLNKDRMDQLAILTPIRKGDRYL
jgi:probable HAF family extracellular repeat protein